MITNSIFFFLHTCWTDIVHFVFEKIKESSTYIILLILRTSLQDVLVGRFFKDCPHPDENQRRQLSRELGLEPRQIKFWFQNKRTQTKVYYFFIFFIFLIFLKCYFFFFVFVILHGQLLSLCMRFIGCLLEGSFV